MDRTYRIEAMRGCIETIRLPAELFRRTGTSGQVWIEFGLEQAPVCTSEGVEGVIGLSADLIGRLRIPLDLPYRARAAVRTVRLGPVIGIVAARRESGLTGVRLGQVADHLLLQEQWGGLVYVCAAEQINLRQRVIEGYRLLPGGAGRWEQERFPLPRALFRRSNVPLGGAADRLKALGIAIFNERAFHKGEAYRWLATDSRLRPFLPETESLEGVSTVLAMLQRWEDLYVKPVWGSGGAGIVRVRRMGAGFGVTPAGQDERWCAGETELVAALETELPRLGAVQQGIALAGAGDRLIDFRVVLQKDGRNRWTVSGIIGRCGPSQHPITTLEDDGFCLQEQKALRLLFGPDPEAIFVRRQEMIRLALRVGAALERTGLTAGDLGLDVAYDRGGRLWLLEVNNRSPHHTMALEVGDWPGFFRLRAMPFAYACHLAGFGRD